MTQTARPLTHRPSLSNSTTTVLPGRQSHARNNSHSHSLLTSSLNPNHRVTRRKSVNSPNANMAALTAALREGDKTASVPIANINVPGRRNTMSKGSVGRGGLVGSLPSPPSSLPNKGMADMKREMSGSAIDDANDMSADDVTAKSQKARVRRASDGQPLTKEGKKSNRVELKCEKCGKGYKHSSCLTKHLWEHTPEWSLTSKLLISKHQQVQLLEAASVLVAMNDKPKDSVTTPPDSAKDFPSSEPESASPTASGYSEQADRLSSADTTPPPMYDGVQINGMSYRNKRHSSVGNFSRSYQSAPSPGSLPPGNGFGHIRQTSDARPTSSGINNTGKDDRDLAAAVELLSCSFGSNNGAGSNGTVMLADAPPVPPVPAQYRDQATSLGASLGASLGNPMFMSSFPSRQPESFTRGEMRRDSVDVKMSDHPDSGVDDDEFDMQPRGRSVDEDDGVFGSMEE
ncbi:hypothetical protein ACRE_001270 [Hapsidospora chrysogenum ATCC 11550]|uniref:C2H2-type domain-containing protein n=1 Tax=Hapsidospora chrysogenum (strain ATCC 11550 / CBS 779.69 / DSM 880 / IAM 14645 / JCM 23072 / IMI 49137) TaxID=857340 RepID=A0A086TI99_HAPC1|nr:hypothetical protein ACRE_001270 [Hapsidospora chrysogenum ATCC 11550]